MSDETGVDIRADIREVLHGHAHGRRKLTKEELITIYEKLTGEVLASSTSIGEVRYHLLVYIRGRVNEPWECCKPLTKKQQAYLRDKLQ